MGRGKKRQGAALGKATSRTPAGADVGLTIDEADAWLAEQEAAPEIISAEAQANSASWRFFVDQLNARIKGKLAPNFYDLDRISKDRAEGKALGVLSPMEQRKLVRVHNEYSGMRRENIRERAAELLILTNAGFVEQMIQGHGARGLEEEVLRQECRLAIFDAIRRFDHENGASFLAFAEWRMRGGISEAIRSDSRLVRLKSRASEIADRVQRAIKLWEANATSAQLTNAFPYLRLEAQGPKESDESFADRRKLHLSRLKELDGIIQAGKGWTPKLIADITGDRVERIHEVLPWVTSSYVRLDAPIATKDGEIDVSSAVPDPLVNVADEVEREGIKETLREAVQVLPLYERRMIELYWNLYDEQEVLQKDLFDGVYLDEQEQQRLSAEQSVIADRRDGVNPRNPHEPEWALLTAKQKELNERYDRGEISFLPGTPEARELYDLSKLSKLPQEAREAAEREYLATRSFPDDVSDKLFALTGVPPTSATVQETLGRSYEQLVPHLESLREFTISRGADALEHSEISCRLVRDELTKMAEAGDGTLNVGSETLRLDEIANLKAGKTAKGGIGRKGRLRKIAEAAGLVDVDSGALTFTPDGTRLVPKAAANSRARENAPSTAGAKPKAQRVGAVAPKPQTRSSAKVRPVDLIQAGVLKPGETFSLLYKSREYKAKLLENGHLQLEEDQNRVFSALSSAAEHAKGVQADPGWNSWRALRDGQWVSLFELRKKYLDGK